MKDLKLICPVNHKGEVVYSDWQHQCLEAFLTAERDRSVQITLTSLRTRSKQQRAYYWAVVIPFIRRKLESAGYVELTDDIVNEFLKVHFNGRTLVPGAVLYKTEITVGRSFEQEPPEVFNRILSAINVFCIEQFGETFPEPLTTQNA
jgi:hypothetical protein